MDLKKVLKKIRSIHLVDSEEEVPLFTDEPKIPSFLCLPNDESTKGFQTDDVFGQGFHPNQTLARIKSLGEFLERLCLYNPDSERFIVSKYNTHHPFIDPSTFFCYSSEQVQDREKKLEELISSEYRWTEVMELTSQRRCLIPTQLVFLSSTFDDEFPIRKERISTGAAFGLQNTNGALRSGFMESLERDACISSYLTKRKIKRIINYPKSTHELVEYLQRYQLEPNIFDVTTDLGVPTVMVITLDSTEIGAAVNIGSSANASYEKAINHAILESIHCRRTSRLIRPAKFPERLPDESEITSMDNRFFYWHPLERVRDLDFWLSHEETIDYDLLRRKEINFERHIKNLERRGYHIFVADLTLPIIRDQGFEVLKIIIPELHPLYLDERAKSLYSHHYGKIKEDFGLKPHPLT